MCCVLAAFGGIYCNLKRNLKPYFQTGKGTKINEKSFISEIQSKRSLWDLSSPGYQRSSEKIVEWERVGNLFNITGLHNCCFRMERCRETLNRMFQALKPVRNGCR